MGVGRGRGGSRGASFMTTNNAHLDGWQSNGPLELSTHFVGITQLTQCERDVT